MERGELKRLKPDSRVCKCCGSDARLYDVVDFNKSCTVDPYAVFLPAGVPVYYYCCAACHFVFTDAFDRLTEQQLGELIYNDDYIKVDAEYLTGRPEKNADAVETLFRSYKQLRVLDFGGGCGATMEALKAKGFSDVTCYDPYHPGFETEPWGEFDLIICFEVFEHIRNPRELVRSISRFFSEDRKTVLLLSTLLQNPDLDKSGRLFWWYAAPRNGHFSLYSEQSLRVLFAPYDYELQSIVSGLHLLVPAPIKEKCPIS